MPPLVPAVDRGCPLHLARLWHATSSSRSNWELWLGSLGIPRALTVRARPPLFVGVVTQSDTQLVLLPVRRSDDVCSEAGGGVSVARR
jgi:hypothetical protein